MRFRLIYEGELKATQRDPQDQQPDRLAVHKQRIRRVFHSQLKQLWATNHHLRTSKASRQFYGLDGFEDITLLDSIREQYHEFKYDFVPLVRDTSSLFCSLDILFLRRDIPGSVITADDMNNRIKTIIDALRRLRKGNELAVSDKVPHPGETPFFCLLEDDSQVGRLVVETDTLLDPPIAGDDAEQRKARLVITVNIHPYNVTSGNINFAGW